MKSKNWISEILEETSKEAHAWSKQLQQMRMRISHYTPVDIVVKKFGQG